MRVPFADNIGGWGSRLKPINWLAVAEKLLLAILVLQCVRLIWAVLTPVGSFGPWAGRQAEFPSVQARQALFSSFDPFNRGVPAQAAGGGVVTSLALTVYGIRLNEGSGLGSAIVAGPDGVQNSYAVGDEIMPGVVLKGVAFDNITIDRGGAEEQVFLDQSQPPPDAPAPAGPAEGGASPAGVAGIDNPTADGLKRDIGFTPRLQNGRVTGLILSAKGPAFQNAGFQPGDVITQVDGQPVGSASDLQALQGKIMPGARVSLMVERGAGLATINLTLQGQ
ncbi:type II secretion system protein N [Sphingobium sp. DC-2]|uniref:type II secretion system protein N n=1 Tax=Sphingobium sp. DC-2 TaxID=1303256 RepID=UPI0004C322E1|nr:type II secretion system protein N [Sphingobium sp. DC-2]